MPEPLTPEHRYRRACAALSWGPEAVARAADIQLRKTRQWGDGIGYCPESLLVWLETLADFHRANPPPPPPPFVRKVGHGRLIVHIIRTAKAGTSGAGDPQGMMTMQTAMFAMPAEPVRRAPVRLPKLSRNDAARACHAALADAISVVCGIHGDRWAMQDGNSALVTIPAALASYTADSGSLIRLDRRRAWRVPAARFWPSGALWPGLEPVADYARETRPILTAEERTDYVEAYHARRMSNNDFVEAFTPAADRARDQSYYAALAGRTPRLAVTYQPKLEAA